MRLGATITTLVLICELLSLLALFVSQEVRPAIFMTVAFFYLAAFPISRFVERFSAKAEKIFSFTLAGGLLFLGLFFIDTSWTPTKIAAHFGPLLFGLLWIQKRSNPLKLARISLAFINLAVACALSPDLALGAILLAFFVLSAVTLSCIYLDLALLKHIPGRAKDYMISAPFIRYTFAIALATFVLSLLIFPILPRRTPDQAGWDQKMDEASRTAYTEKIDLSQWNTLTGAGTGKVVLRIYFPDVPVQQRFFKVDLGALLRTRVFSGFDGTEWAPLRSREIQTAATHFTLDTPTFEIIREPIGTAALPIPQGFGHVSLGQRHRGQLLLKNLDREWFVPSADKERLHYHLDHNPERNTAPPIESDLTLPEWSATRLDPWKKLQQKLLPPKSNVQQKISALRSFIIQEHFGVSTGPSKNPQLKELPPLDRFLFYDKKGHCELYSTAFAMLLRLSGVPTRLVAGFRVSRESFSGMQIVREGDAHAWLEVYDPQKGWLSFDPTPMQLGMGSSLSDFATEISVYLSGYWYRYVLSFSAETQAYAYFKVIKTFFKGKNRSLFISLALLLVLSLLVLISYRIYQKTKRSKNWDAWFGPPTDPSNRVRGEFKRYRKKMSRLLKSKNTQSLEQLSQHPTLRQWHELDQYLRFGPVTPDDPRWNAKTQKLAQLWKAHHQKWKNL